MQASPIIDCRCRLGEGPLWHPEEHALYWTDIEMGKVYRYQPIAEQTDLVYYGDKVGGMTLQRDGSLLMFLDRGSIKILHDGSLNMIHEEIAEERATRFNDVIAAPNGGALCGLLPTMERQGRLYRLDPDGAYTILLEGIGCSNGLTFSEGGTKLYYTDSVAGEIYHFDYDDESGGLSNRRTFWRRSNPQAVPDGLTVDQEGCVWTAQYGGGCVIRLRPDGSEDRRIEVPDAPGVTSVAFGGDDLRDLYITTAWQNHAGAQAGNIFRVRPGVAGVAEYRTSVRRG